MGLGDDARLLAGLAAGREEAFAALFDRYAGRLFGTAVSMLGRPEDAEDVVQEVFAAVVRSQHKMSAVRDLTAYLFAALRRAAGQQMARRARQPRSCDEVETAVAPAGHSDPRTELLPRALAALPAEQREVIAMKIHGELTFAQIGQTLGISPNTAASRYRYALEGLRRAMQEKDP